MTMMKEVIPNDRRDILIVDDEEENLLLLESILKPEGYGIRRAYSGREAVEAVAWQLPDLVVMDVRMPEMSGFDACRQIKSSSREHFVPVILLTNLKTTESQVAGLDAGADEYLFKPAQKPELLARVRAMLRIRDLQENLLSSKRELERASETILRSQQIIEEEMRQVGSIQKSFLPTQFPENEKIEFGCYYGPCEQAGGDYFDVIDIGKSHWGLLIADVTGHGAPAAVVMAITHTLMHSFVNTFHYPSTALKVANEKLSTHLAPTFYVTMFYGVLNLQAMQFRYASAGHEPMMLYRSQEKRVDYLKTDRGFPLKLLESSDYDEQQVSIEPNDKIILFTDGLVEVKNRKGELFTPERLEPLVHKYHALRPQAFVDAIITEVKQFNKDRPFQDDITLFVVERTI